MKTNPMFFPDNSPDAVKQRKYQSTLDIVGKGILLFGAWTVVKTFGRLFLERAEFLEELRKVTNEAAVPVGADTLLVIAVLFLTVYLGVGVAARTIVGFSAMAEADGRQCGNLYIILTALMILVSLFETGTGISNLIGSSAEGADPAAVSAATVIVELTSLIMMLEMLFAVSRLRKYRRQESQNDAPDRAYTLQEGNNAD